MGCGTLQASAQRSLGFAWGLVAAWPAAQASRVTRPHPRPPPACACRSSSPRPLAFAPAARPPVGRRPIRPSRLSGRRPIAPSGRLVHRCRPPRAALGGSTSRRPRARRTRSPPRPSAAAPPAGRAPGRLQPASTGGRRWRQPAGAWGGGRWTEGGGGRRPAPWAAAALRCCAGAAGGLERRAPAASEPARAPSVARCTVSLVLFRPRSLVRLASPLGT